MGINMPTKTSVFAGDAVFLNGMNYRQMAGRAGRRGCLHIYTWFTPVLRLVYARFAPFYT